MVGSVKKLPLTSWIPRRAAKCVFRYRLMGHGRTLDRRRCGNTRKRPEAEFLASQCISDRLERTTKGRRPEDAAWWLRGPSWGMRWRNLRHARWCAIGNENLENVGARDMGSRVRCNVNRTSTAIGARLAEAGETCCACG